MKLRINPLVAEDLKTIQEIYTRIENIQQFPYMGADLSKRVSFRMDFNLVEEAAEPSQYRKVMEKIFEKMGQSQHYKMMYGE